MRSRARGRRDGARLAWDGRASRGRRRPACEGALPEAPRPPSPCLRLKGLRRRPWGDRLRSRVDEGELAYAARVSPNDRRLRPHRQHLVRAYRALDPVSSSVGTATVRRRRLDQDGRPDGRSLALRISKSDPRSSITLGALNAADAAQDVLPSASPVARRRAFRASPRRESQFVIFQTRRKRDG